jgi:tetratricopeptide (TPR) repeat protein
MAAEFELGGNPGCVTIGFRLIFRLAFCGRALKTFARSFDSFMQAQDAPELFLYKVWPQIEENKKIIFVVIGVILAGTLIFSYVSWHAQQQEISAGQEFTKVMMSPTSLEGGKQYASDMLAVASQHPGTATALRAQLQAAITLFTAGQYPEAQAEFQKLLEANPGNYFKATSALGVAASLEAQGKIDLATTAYQAAASYSDSATSLAANFALGRLYEAAGKLNEAVTYYSKLAAATSTDMGNEAKMRLSILDAKIAATKPATSAAQSAPVNTAPAMMAAPATH